MAQSNTKNMKEIASNAYVEKALRYPITPECCVPEACNDPVLIRCLLAGLWKNFNRIYKWVVDDRLENEFYLSLRSRLNIVKCLRYGA